MNDLYRFKCTCCPARLRQLFVLHVVGFHEKKLTLQQKQSQGINLHWPFLLIQFLYSGKL